MFIFLIILLLLIYVVASFFITYHLVKYGYDTKTKLLAVVFSIGVIALIIAFLLQYQSVDFPTLFSEDNGFDLNPFK